MMNTKAVRTLVLVPLTVLFMGADCVQCNKLPPKLLTFPTICVTWFFELKLKEEPVPKRYIGAVVVPRGVTMPMDDVLVKMNDMVVQIEQMTDDRYQSTLRERMAADGDYLYGDTILYFQTVPDNIQPPPEGLVVEFTFCVENEAGIQFDDKFILGGSDENDFDDGNLNRFGVIRDHLLRRDWICNPFDHEPDGDVDLPDFAGFQRCFSGPGQPVDPGCRD